MTITGQWGKPSEVLLDIVVNSDGEVSGIVNPGRQNAPIKRGHFDSATRSLEMEGNVAAPDGRSIAFRIAGRLDGHKLCLSYTFDDDNGEIEIARVEDYRPPRLTVADRLKAVFADAQRNVYARFRPSGKTNARRLQERGESLESIRIRDAVVADIPALAELHVKLWNATYRTSHGPSVATRTRQWQAVFDREPRRDFVVIMEDRDGRLIGFAFGKPNVGEFDGQLAKIYLRWEFHGLGLGRRLMEETARRFLERGIRSFILFAERSNPTIGFYDRMGGERLVDDRGLFTGAYGWRDARTLIRDL
jgi:GNAT superfamily N-acetyltransferase